VEDYGRLVEGWWKTMEGWWKAGGKLVEIWGIEMLVEASSWNALSHVCA